MELNLLTVTGKEHIFQTAPAKFTVVETALGSAVRPLQAVGWAGIRRGEDLKK